MAEQPSEAAAVKTLGDDARQAWRLHAERIQGVIRELRAAKLTREDPAAFVGAVEELPEEITMSSMLQQRAKLSLANAAVLECMQALPLGELPEKLRYKALRQSRH
jgi:hypothetical protein